MKFLSRLFRSSENTSGNTRDNNNYYNSIVAKHVNSSNFSSTTNYLIWVDLKNFKVNIFNGSANKWMLIDSYLCTIGKPSTPTPKGSYTTGVKGLYFSVNKGYKCWYYTQFKENYLFHSILYNLDGSVRDGRLGMALSDGCIRLAKVNAKWIWDNIPIRTKVIIS